jgi:acetylornithine deacetylase/succinyl-diaminopimelate desuccinylase-like protein
MPNQEELAHEANEYIEEDALYELVSIYKDAMIALSELKI